MSDPAPNPPGLGVDVAAATAWDDPRADTEETAEVACTACGTVLEPVFGDATDYQFDNALWIGLHGGYGMFTDMAFSGEPPTTLAGRPDHQAVLCHDCAHRLTEVVPWLGEMIDPVRSHAHPHTRDWTGHVGWDLPHRRG